MSSHMKVPGTPFDNGNVTRADVLKTLRAVKIKDRVPGVNLATLTKTQAVVLALADRWNKAVAVTSDGTVRVWLNR